MKTKVITWTIAALAVLACGAAYATTADEYVASGRLHLFNGSLSGIREGYDIFKTGINDPACPDCASSRKLIFFHALSRMAMWAVRNDGAPTDSALELAEQNGFHLTGDMLSEIEFSSDWKINRRDAYDLPADLEAIILNIAVSLGTDGLTEINAVLAELDGITETPENRFRIFLTPEETHAFMDPMSPPLSYDLEVDYTDVLMLKGILSAVKAGIQTFSAYDLNPANKEKIVQKLYGECFSINNDLLLPNPQFMNVLPADGAAALAQARQTWIEALTYYQLAMDSMDQEDNPEGTDPQDDELFYIANEDRAQNQKLKERLAQLLDSLQNDTAQNYVYESLRTYNIECAGCDEPAVGRLDLNLDILEQPEDGALQTIQCAGIPSTWELSDIEVIDSEISASLRHLYSDPAYNYCWNGNLYYAPSVLFTPPQCQGSPAYTVEVLPDCLFSEMGTAQGWHADDQMWIYTLPFEFPFFGTTYTQIYVSSNGFIDFTGAEPSYYDYLSDRIRIEPFGYNLRTDLAGGDIYIAQPDPDQLVIRWAAHYYNTSYPCNFAVVLYRNGSFRFDYGYGNQSLSPYVGIGNGNWQSTIYLTSGWNAWSWGYLSGIIDPNDSSINNLQLSFWGQPYASLNNLTAVPQETQTQNLLLDLNPLLGSTPRYPQPVNPRDLAPQFNPWWNRPLPSTMGYGLADDPTLGGILPEMTQFDWNLMFNSQPTAHLDWQEIPTWQLVHGWPYFWFNEQLIFEDPLGDVQWDDENIENCPPGVDIAALYMGYDWDNYLQGEITCDQMPENGYYVYDVILSYCPTQPEVPGSLRIHIVYGDGIHADLQIYGGPGIHYASPAAMWSNIALIEVLLNDNRICFRVPSWIIPAGINGRYISLNSFWRRWEDWYYTAKDINETQIQIGTCSTLSGTVSYNGYIGAPIYIQAFVDLENPDESVVASTMIAAPGPYQLDGIPLGWQGYVRAFTPLFGLNLTDLDAITIESVVEAYLRYPLLKNVNLVLENPPVLQQDVWMDGQLDEVSKRTAVFAFDAVKGAEYCFEPQPTTETYFALSLHGRNGNDDIYEIARYSSSMMSFCWTCPVSGRYYLKIENRDWYINGAYYQVRYTSNVTCPFADISGPEWAGVRDCYVNFSDFALLADHWLQTCGEPYWCDDSDYNKTHQVDADDLEQLISEWLDSGFSI